ncbi:MAG TPA: hypothetical protein EYQ46_21560 [Myxococcales bacterium]|nr:hypothetical protein [Myxococcales bacterium]
MTTRDAAFGIVLPIGSLGSSQISIDLGAGIQVAISGSGENDSGVTGEFGLDVRETIGLRVTLPEFWRDE